MSWDGPHDEPGLQGPPVWREQDAKCLKEGFWFSKAHADHAESVARFVITKRGDPIVLADYQRAFLRRIYGWQCPAQIAWDSLGLEGKAQQLFAIRRYKAASLWCSKGNGKTPTAAMIGLEMLSMENEPQAHIEIMANTADQAADLTFGDMKKMIEGSPALNAQIMLTSESIFHPASSSRARVLPVKESSLHGLRPFLMAYDEVHTFNKRSVYSATQRGLKKIPNSLELITSSLGTNHLLFGMQMFEADEKLWDGSIEDPRRLVLAFYNDPANNDWKDPKLWAEMNPAWGLPWGPKEVEMRADMVRMLSDPGGEPDFRVLHVGQKLKDAVAAIKSQLWKDADHTLREPGVPYPTIQTLVNAKAEWFFGLDMSLTNDITAFVALAKLPNGMHYVYPFLYAPEECLAYNGIEHRVDYEAWAKAGHLLKSPGTQIETGQMVADAAAFHKQCGGFTMGHGDPNYAREALQQLQDSHNIPTARVAQNSNTYTPAAAKLQELLISRKIIHPGNPVLNWMASNLTYIKSRHGIMIRKYGQKGSDGSGGERRYKIDGMAALLMALQASVITPSAPPFDFNASLEGMFG